jgi:hypothetical protein
MIVQLLKVALNTMKPSNHLIGYHIIDIMDIWIFLKRINSIGGVIVEDRTLKRHILIGVFVV